MAGFNRTKGPEGGETAGHEKVALKQMQEARRMVEIANQPKVSSEMFLHTEAFCSSIQDIMSMEESSPELANDNPAEFVTKSLPTRIDTRANIYGIPNNMDVDEYGNLVPSAKIYADARTGTSTFMQYA